MQRFLQIFLFISLENFDLCIFVKYEDKKRRTLVFLSKRNFARDLLPKIELNRENCLGLVAKILVLFYNMQNERRNDMDFAPVFTIGQQNFSSLSFYRL